jgi:hypothetical protein
MASYTDQYKSLCDDFKVHRRGCEHQLVHGQGHGVDYRCLTSTVLRQVVISLRKAKNGKIKDMLKICPKFDRVPIAYHLPISEIINNFIY